MNLRLETPDYTRSPLQVSQPSSNADLSLNSPNSLGFQSTKSCLRNRGLTNYLLASARCSLDEKKAFFSFGDRSNCACEYPRRKALQRCFAASSSALIAGARYGRVRCRCKVESLLLDLKLRESCVVSHFRSVRLTWLVALKQSLRMELTARRLGQVRRSSQSD